MTDDLITWLRAQIDRDEDEAARALAVTAHSWPRRMLCEVDAKRRILDRYDDILARQGDWEHSQMAADICEVEYRDWVIPALALPYAAREGYQERKARRP